MPRLSNQKHEAFAQNIAKGMNNSKAYVEAGYSKVGANANAARLIANDSILQRVDELREQVEKRNELTLDWLIKKGKQLLDDCEKAKDRSSAASFYDKLCKIRGAYSAEKVEHSGEITQVTRRIVKSDKDS